MVVILKRLGLALTGLLGSLMAAGLLLQQTHTVCTLEEPMTLPARLDGAEIMALYFTGYDGPYWEDGSGEEIADGACLMIRNDTGMDLARLHITLQTQEAPLEFTATFVPAGARLLILEQGKASYTAQTVLSGCVEAEPCQSGFPFTGAVQVREEGMGTLVLTNHSSDCLQDLTLYHKGYFNDLLSFTGGITYETHVEQIGPGQTVKIRPAFYARGYSRVLGIQAGENKPVESGAFHG